jgi:putative CocE/NonD family hydrolase
MHSFRITEAIMSMFPTTESLESADLLTRRDLLTGMNAALLALCTSAQLPALARDPSSLPTRTHEVHEIENTWIPMRDGVKLAARIWMPANARQHPVPAIWNYCPYFARLFTRPDDDAIFPYYASHGYACVRVDIRGSGDSQGQPLDEYVKQEQDDGVEVIAWIASQPWCSGAVGMEGISWSGFNSLQVAARRPPALKAIITLCSTDDRYTDDAHYKGGCIVSDMFDWGTVFLAFQGQAPDPEITGRDAWRQTWLERLNAVDFNLGRWLDHQHRDAFWRHASVIEDYSQIACPVYAIGGWVDAYKNSIFRLLGGLKVPRKGLVGPWTHIYPHQGVPGPAIGYLDEALRWWDHWLKRADTGIMDEPMLRVWMQDKSATPGEDSVPGNWAAEDAWPSKRMSERNYFLNAGSKLAASEAPQEALVLHPVQTVGMVSGKWCPSGAGTAEDLNTELPLDQRLDDARSLVFDSPPLDNTFEILGACALTLELSADKPVAFIAVRLNEVLPTGESSRVSYGILNLCHRDGDAAPTALEPGRRYTVKISLDNAAHRFHAGNRVRISISTTYWPLILPAPEPVTLTVFTGSSRLTLPERPTRAADDQLRPFGPPFVPPVAVQTLSSKPGSTIVEWDGVNKKQVIRHEVGDSVVLLTAINTRLVGNMAMRSEIGDEDTTSSIATDYVMGWQRDAWRPRVVASAKITMTKSDFVMWGKLTAFDGDEQVFTRTWDRKILRQLV